MKILVVEDDRTVGEYVRRGLSEAHYQADLVNDGQEALRLASDGHYDLMVLDLRLPGLSGLEVLRTLRDRGVDLPVLVLTAQDAVDWKVQALRTGADDYVTKPFGVAELMARIRAALRHGLQANDQEPVFVNGDLRVDLVRRQVNLAGSEVHLSPKEYDLLKELVTHSGRVLTHQHLLKQVWGPAHVEETQYLRVYIGQLRQKVEPDPARPRYIVTEPGVGYRLKEPETISG